MVVWSNNIWTIKLEIEEVDVQCLAEIYKTNLNQLLTVFTKQLVSFVNLIISNFMS